MTEKPPEQEKTEDRKQPLTCCAIDVILQASRKEDLKIEIKELLEWFADGNNYLRGCGDPMIVLFGQVKAQEMLDKLNNI